MKKIIFFGAPWCGKCRMVKPIMDIIKDELSGGDISYEYLDCSETKNSDIAASYNLWELPAIVFINGDFCKSLTGLVSEGRIREYVEQLQGED